MASTRMNLTDSMGSKVVDVMVQCITANQPLETWMEHASREEIVFLINKGNWSDPPGKDCLIEACHVWRWDGNPDIAGVGMLATYIIQASLVTIYLFALISARFNLLPIKPGRHPWFSRTLLAIQHSAASFLSASTIFCIAMLFASLCATVDESSNARSTTWILMLLMPVGSTLPVLMLQLAASDILRRAKGRVLLWLAVAILTLALLVRTITAVFEPFRSSSTTLLDKKPSRWEIGFSDWESFCLQRIFISPMIFLSWAIAGLLCLGSIVYVIRLFISRRSKSRRKGRAWLSATLWWSTLIFAFCSMWTCVGFFIYLTVMLRGIARNGKDKDWSFGQILALATWVPFIVEFAYIWWEEPEKALNGRLIDPYVVVEAPAKTASVELERGDRAESQEQSERLL